MTIRNNSYRNDELLREFEHRKGLHQAAAVVMMVALVLVVLVSQPNTAFLNRPGTWWSGIMLGLLLAAFGMNLFHWRCPACKRFLGTAWNPPSCPSCNTSFRE